MKYKCELKINLPRNLDVSLYDNIENSKKWMPGVYDIERVSGDGGKRTLNKYYFNGGKRIIKETISYNDLPKEIVSVFTTGSVKNPMRNVFIDNGDKTLWESYVEFNGGFIFNLMIKLFLKKFKDQSLKNMNAFKRWAEKQ